MKIIASIVLYNPDIERLSLNIKAILPQVSELIIVNNGSKNFGEVIDMTKEYTDISFIDNEENLGIATALNQAAVFAQKNDYNWIITLDQDSVAPENLVSVYSSFVNEKKK